MAKRIRDGKGHRAYRRQQAALKRRTARTGLTCTLCGQPFDLTLPDTDRMSFTGGHPLALARGGRLAGQELQPQHRACNASLGDRAATEIWGAS